MADCLQLDDFDIPLLLVSWKPNNMVVDRELYIVYATQQKVLLNEWEVAAWNIGHL